MRRPVLLLVVLLVAVPATVATAQQPGQPEGVSVPPGYELRSLVTGLDFPTGIAGRGQRLWVGESGVMNQEPKVKELALGQEVETILSSADLPEGTLLPPLIDVTAHRGWLWISHLQVGANRWHVGAISKFRPDDPVGTFTTVLTNLPSSGDHHTNEIVFHRSGRAYFSQGSATNSGVVGLDNLFVTGWLATFPDFRDFPPKDVVLSGANFTTLNPLTDDPDDTAVTAPFMPFGSGPVAEGTVVQGATPRNPQEGIIAGVGTVYSFRPSADDPASTLRLEAWGLRNPFGIGLDPLRPRRLFAANNGADIRTARGPELAEPVEPDEDELVPVGSRPIAGDYDDLYAIRVGGRQEFFGWPDYFHDEETGAVLPVTDPMFCDDLSILPCSQQFLFAERFRRRLKVQEAFAQFEEHSSANKFDFSTSRPFGFFGDLFVAETGSFPPITGAEELTGFRVVRVDRHSGEVSDFIVNEGETPEELFDPAGFNKPIDVKFRQDAMLIVDFGIFEPGIDLVEPNTGKVWLAHKEGTLDEFGVPNGREGR